MMRIGRPNLIAAGTAIVVIASGCTTSVPGTPTGVTRPARETATDRLPPTDPDSSFNKTVLDRKAVEKSVVALIRNSYYMNATEASCPKAEQTEVKPGNTFECIVVIDDDDKSVTITVKDTDGTYEVGVPR